MKNTTPTIVPTHQFEEVLSLIQSTRHQVYAVVNSQLIELYWSIGLYISHQVKTNDWGTSVVAQLADYIQQHEPGIEGFSKQNLWRMRQFYEAYSGADEIISPLVRQITWTNNMVILSRCKSFDERLYYMQACIRERWSKRELERQVDAAVYERAMLDQPKLSPVMREMLPNAPQYFKDRYVLEFVQSKDMKPENSFRHALIAQMKSFILELGKDFIFVGEEYPIQVGSSDFRVDLLFYNRELQCLVAFELKTEKFKPEHLGQLNFYLEALDRDVRKPHENPSIGILLCKDKDNEVVEYALSRSLSPTMVAEYQLQLPDKKVLQAKLHDILDNELED